MSIVKDSAACALARGINAQVHGASVMQGVTGKLAMNVPTALLFDALVDTFADNLSTRRFKPLSEEDLQAEGSEGLNTPVSLNTTAAKIAIIFFTSMAIQKFVNKQPISKMDILSPSVLSALKFYQLGTESYANKRIEKLANMEITSDNVEAFKNNLSKLSQRDLTSFLQYINRGDGSSRANAIIGQRLAEAANFESVEALNAWIKAQSDNSGE